MKFNLPKDQSSIVKVIGVGGGGSNAVNHMYRQGIVGVDFVVCNTDSQALESSPVPNKVQLGTSLTEGLGAGAKPSVGKNAAIEDIESIRAILENNTKMVFVTAGLGGGTGTGAAPIIAEVARGMGILTVGIVTVPFSFEGRRRKLQADEGLEELRKQVDTLLIINNDKLRVMHGNLKMSEAFSKADDVLASAAKGIAEIITVAGYVNVDFEDVKTVIKDGGTAIMGSATAEGEDRAVKAVSNALSSPLLNDNEIKGANFILLNITSGKEEITMDEIDEITDYIQNETGYTAELIWGNGIDETLGDRISVTIIATGFGAKEVGSFKLNQEPERVVRRLDEDVPTNITQEVDEKENESIIEAEEPYLKTTEEKPIEQTNIEFDFTSSSIDKVEEEIANENPKEVVLFNLEDDLEEIENKREISSENDEMEKKIKTEDEVSDEEQIKRSQERIMRLKDLTIKMNTAAGVSDLEKEPAYKRRKVDLEDTPHSSENNISRFTLSEDEEGGPKLNEDNSFLHDNVD